MQTSAERLLARRRRRRRAAAALLGLALGLIFAEIALRACEWANPLFNIPCLQEADFELTGHRYLHDPVLGWRNIPGWRSTTYGKPLTINSKGLRSPEYQYEKPQGVCRILVLGDSYAWGCGVADDELFSAVLERKMREGGDACQTLNAGVSGWGSDQEYLYLIHEGWKYEPDLVVMALYTRNDLLNNSFSIQYGLPKPRFAVGLKLLGVPVPYSFRDAENKLWAARPGFLSRHTSLGRLLLTRSLGYPSLLTSIGGLGLADVKRLRPRYSSENPVELAVSIVEATLRFCDEREFRFKLAKFGSFLSEGRPIELKIDSAFEERLLERIPDLDYVDLDERFAKRGLTETMLTEGNRDGHWNAFGHRQTAEILYRSIREDGLLAGSGP